MPVVKFNIIHIDHYILFLFFYLYILLLKIFACGHRLGNGDTVKVSYSAHQIDTTLLTHLIFFM